MRSEQCRRVGATVWEVYSSRVGYGPWGACIPQALRKRILTVPFVVLEIMYICTVKYCVCKYSYKYNMYYYI